jgi:ribosomal protein S18 acetylase RimI-like enzyme
MRVNMNFAQLDNPAWYALTGHQQQYAVGTDHIKCFQRNVLPFAAYETPSLLSAIGPYLEDVFYIIGDLAPLPSNWIVLKELPCVQMILQSPIAATDAASPLNVSHSKAMLDLINKVQPGFYKADTRLLGDYYGVFQDDKLVAVAGERLRLENFTELSAVCTDPDYTGRKYAQHLITHLCNTNLSKGNIPFLHVLQTNERAIRLYEHMGFTRRRLISFWQLKKA